MRLLCDHNVAAKYVQAFLGREQFVVTTVADELSHDASDKEIGFMILTVLGSGFEIWVSRDGEFDPHSRQAALLLSA